MTDAPKRIWAWEIDHETIPPNGYYATDEVDDSTEYIRADIAGKHVEFWRDLGERKDLHGWRDIETAPKETDVLVYLSGYSEFLRVRVAGNFAGDWLSFQDPDTPLEKVSHWMPLPEPPK